MMAASTGKRYRCPTCGAEFIVTRGLATELGSLDDVAGAYIAFDCDVLDPSQIDCFMPEPDGISLDRGWPWSSRWRRERRSWGWG